MDRRIEAGILASEVSNLENLEGFFLTPGYTLKLTLPYVKPEPRSEGFLPAKRGEPVFAKASEDEPPESDALDWGLTPADSIRPAKAPSNHQPSGDALPFGKE